MKECDVITSREQTADKTFAYYLDAVIEKMKTLCQLIHTISFLLFSQPYILYKI